MSKTYTLVALKNVLTHRHKFIEIDDFKMYKRCRVQLHTQGIIERDVVPGAEIKTKKQQLCNANEFLVAEIDAKVGGFGIVPEDLDNSIVSSHYFLFTIDEAQIHKKFLEYYIHTPEFMAQVQAKGSTNYAAIRPSDVLNYQVPLPPLEEQRRIVARIEELASKIEEARKLHQESEKDANILISSNRKLFFEHALQNNSHTISDLATLERGKFSHRPRNDPSFFGGDHPWIQIAEIEASNKYIKKWTQTLNEEGLAISKKFPKGTLLISIAATIGATGILEFDCCIPDSIVAVTPKSGISSEYLYHYFGYLRNHLEIIAPQNAQKNINLEILSTMRIPLLKEAEQQEIVNHLNYLQAKIEILKQKQAESLAELNALLPSILDKAFKGEL